MRPRPRKEPRVALVRSTRIERLRFEYNSKGKTIRETEPVGRETVFVYLTGSTPDADQANGTGIDLLQVKQKSGASYDLLSRSSDPRGQA